MSDNIIAQLKAVLSIDSRGFDVGINSANKSLSEAAKNAGKASAGFAGMDGGFRTAAKGADFLKASLGALAKATVVLGLLDLGRQAVQTATKFDSYNKALESTLGSTQRVKKEMKALKEIAKLPGIGLEESIQSFQRFVSVGLDVSRSKKLLEGLGKVNAKGGGSTEDFNEASRQFSQILSAGKITDENLGVIKERLPAFAKVLRDTFKTTTAAGLKDAGVNVDQFLAKVIPAMESAKGVTNTAQNSFDNLGSATTDALNTIGSSALPLVTGAMDALSNVITKVSGDFTAFAESPIGKTIADNFGKGFTILGDAAKVVGDVVTDALKSVGLVLTSGDIKNGLKSFSDGFKNAATAIKGFVSSNGFKSFVTGFVGGIKIVVDVVRPAAAFIVAQFERVVAWFQQNMPLIQRTVTTVLTFIREFWAAHGAQIMAVVEPIWNQIKLVISTALSLIMGTVKLAMQIITGDWRGAGDTIKNIASDIWSFIQQTFVNIGTYIVNAVVAIVSGLADLNARIGAAAKSIGKSILDGILAYLSGLWESVKKSILGAFDKIGELSTDIIAKGKTLGEWIVSGIKDGLAAGNIGQALVGMVQTAWANIKQTTKDLIQGTEDAAKKAAAAKELNRLINDPNRPEGSYVPERAPMSAKNSKEMQSRLMGAYAAPLVLPLPKGIKPKITGDPSVNPDKKNNFAGPASENKAPKAERSPWLKQVDAFKSDLQSARQAWVDTSNDPRASLQAKFPLLDFKSGNLKKFSDQYIALLDKTRKKEEAESAESGRKSNFDSLRVSVLKLRDTTVEGQVAANTYKLAYKDLSDEQKKNIAGTIALTKEENRLNQVTKDNEKADERSEQRKKERKKVREDLAKAAADAVKKETDRINELIGSIAKLKNEYAAMLSGNDFDKFLAKSTGKTQAEIIKESGILELGRQKDLFDASQLNDQAGKLDGLKDRLKSMREELGLVKFANTEARLSFEIFGKSIDQLAPEIQQKIRDMVPEFDKLSKFKRLKAQMDQVKSTIKDTFRDAFQASLQRGESFFQNLTLGFKNLLQSIIAEWAANEAVKGIFKLFGAKTDGLSKDTGKAKSDLVTGALSVSAAAVMIREAAKYWEQAAQTMPVAAGMPGSGLGFGAGGAGAGAGVAGMAGQVAGGLAGKFIGAKLGTSLGAFGGPLGMLAGGLIGGGIGKLFGGLFASGGVPPMGKFSIVGERGPELFVPNQAGRIHSNADSKSILSNIGGSGGGDVNFNGVVNINDRADVARIQSMTRAKRQSKLRLA